jgi:hypothetical protein
MKLAGGLFIGGWNCCCGGPPAKLGGGPWFGGGAGLGPPPLPESIASISCGLIPANALKLCRAELSGRGGKEFSAGGGGLKSGGGAGRA